MKVIRFSWEDTLHTLSHHGLSPDDFLFSEKQAFTDDAGNRFSPPRIFPLPPNGPSLPEFFKSLSYQQGEVQTGTCAILLLRAGRGAFALWENGSLLRQKILTKYVVRAGQGKAQSSHNRQKSAHSAGANLRSRNEANFIKEVAALLDKWSGPLSNCNPIFYSSPVRLWGEILRAQRRPVISKRDPRVQPLGINMGRPGMAELQRICFELSHGTLELV